MVEQTVEPNVSPPGGTRVPAIALRILSNFQPFIAKLAIKNAFLNEEASIYLLSRMPINTTVDTSKLTRQNCNLPFPPW